MDAYEGLVERITDLTLVRCTPMHISSTFTLTVRKAVKTLPAHLQRSEAINQEKNRAQKAAQYAELRCAFVSFYTRALDLELLNGG